MSPRKGDDEAAINFSCVHPSNLVLYSLGVLHLSVSPRETGVKKEREILGHHFTNIPNKILFSNRAPSKQPRGKVDPFFVGDCLYNFLQL